MARDETEQKLSMDYNKTKKTLDELTKVHEKLKEDYDAEMSSGNAARAEQDEENVSRIEELENLTRTLNEDLDGANNKCMKDEAIYK